MEDSFFGFKTNFPNRNVFEQFEEQLLPNRVEEEYDALNDETFGIGAEDGDWEEDHDKFAETVNVKEKSTDSAQSSFFGSSFYDEEDGDESQNEIVSQTISHLGLEDDLDDPAIMTVGRMKNTWPKIPRSSPPPPAILDPEFCGSPKTHSIWSTNSTSTPNKESIGSLFSTINNSSNSYQKQSSPNINNIFASPSTQKAWTVEEIERDLTSTKSSDWFPIPKTATHTHQNRRFPRVVNPADLSDDTAKMNTVRGIRTLNDVETDILSKAQTVEEIERSMKSKATQVTEAKIGGVVQPVNLQRETAVSNANIPNVNWPHFNNCIRPPSFPIPLIRPQGLPPGIPFPPYPIPGISPDKANNFQGFRSFPGLNTPARFFPYLIDASYDIPRRQLFYPTSVLNPQNMRGLAVSPGRFIRHPLLGTTIPDYLWHQNNFVGDGDFRRMPLPDNFDEYAGLMTQSEKEWLLRIQVMLVQSSNPYFDDFYYSTFLTRKNEEKNKSSKKEGPKLLLPEKAKTETKAYVPAQFEGSLGKLQAVSVNYPRKVLDITVSRSLEDEDGQPVTSQSVTKNRRLLVNIEKLYNTLLEIDDEEKRILALPEDAHQAHRENIDKLTEKIFSGFGSDSVITSDTFHNIMMVRKGRNLGMRAFQLFSDKQKCSFLVALSRCLSHVLRKDQNELILLKNVDVLLDCIKSLGLSDIVAIGQSLENLPRTDTVIVPVKEKSNFISAFKNKFGSTVVCCLIDQAESIYVANVNVDSEGQAKWAKVIQHIVDIICTVPDSSIVPPLSSYDNLLAHFQRFAIDRDKFEVLKKKLSLFKGNTNNCENAV